MAILLFYPNDSHSFLVCLIRRTSRQAPSHRDMIMIRLRPQPDVSGHDATGKLVGFLRVLIAVASVDVWHVHPVTAAAARLYVAHPV